MTSAGLGARWHVKFSFTSGFNENTTQTVCFQATFFCIRKIEIINQPTSQSLYGSAEVSAWKCQAVPLCSMAFLVFRWSWKHSSLQVFLWQGATSMASWRPCNTGFPWTQEGRAWLLRGVELSHLFGAGAPFIHRASVSGSLSAKQTPCLSLLC